MRKNNSYSKINHIPEIDDITEERMFLSMKETLHNPLKVIKSKELLDFFYKENSIEKESTKLNSTNKKNINFSEFEETNNKTDEKNNINNININNNTNKSNICVQEKDYEDIIFTTSPMIYPENNLDKINIEENNNNIRTEVNNASKKEKEKNNKNKNQNKKEAFKQIKNIAKDITEKINSFQICETTSKYSIEQSYPKSDIGKYYQTIKNINNQIFPF